MVTVTLTESMVNAIGAALDARNKSLVSQLVRLKSQPESQSRDFAIEATEGAIRDCITARLTIAQALEEPEYPDDMVFALIGQEPDTSVIWHEYLDR